ncbi:hypothetical protein EKO17_24430 [Enterobacter hormaechei subsp. xiangfangensis]|nr:hypothetical protein EKO17_24430 [Enterobacter hormaechei subsp. xiangfangensis]
MDTKASAATLSAVSMLRISGSGSSATSFTSISFLYALAKMAFCMRSSSCRVGRPSAVTSPAVAVSPSELRKAFIKPSLLLANRFPLSAGANRAISSEVIPSASAKAFSLAAMS